VPAIYWLAGMLYDRRVGLIAAALFTFNAYSVRYSQEARSYALFLLLATLSSGFLVAFLRQGTRRNRVGYVLVSVLAVYAHFYALLLLAAQWLTVRWVKPDGAARSQLRRAWSVIGVAVLPLLIFVAKTGAGPIRWIPRPRFRDLLGFYVQFAGGNSGPLALIFIVACVAAVIPVGKNLLSSDQPWETWRCQFLLVWLLFPIVLTFLLSLARPVFLGRYMIFCLPALLILVAAGLARLRRTWLIAPCLAGIILLSLQGVRFVYGHDFDNERDASGVASDFILDHTQAGDAVIFHIAETRVPYEFFRSIRAGENTASSRFTAQLGPEIIFPRHGEGLDYRDFTGKATEDLVRAAAGSHRRVWLMLMNNGAAGNPDATTVMLTRVLSESFPAVERWGVSRVEVRLYGRE
jgi:mannosyltransferase